MPATVAELWRYPVKSMRGERLPAARLTGDGVPGDRRWAHVDGRGYPVTARRDRRLARAGPARRDEFPYRLARVPSGAFDVAPVLVVSLPSVAALAAGCPAAADHRRFRANVYLDGLEPGIERRWPGRRLRLGGALLRAVDLCERCVVVNLDPDSPDESPEVLRAVIATGGLLFGVYCEVVEPGDVAEGDRCELA